MLVITIKDRAEITLVYSNNLQRLCNDLQQLEAIVKRLATSMEEYAIMQTIMRYNPLLLFISHKCWN